MSAVEPVFRPGDTVRFSEEGAEKVRAMPEAWGLHRALHSGETGEVIDYLPAEGEEPARLSVAFPGGEAHLWDASCFTGEPLRGCRGASRAARS
jgi:hypothetical protein